MDLSGYFVCDPSFAHLNAATRTRVPLPVLGYMESERRLAEQNPTKAMFLDYDRIWSVQQRIASYLGASPHEFFFRHNVTNAFSDFLFALPDIGTGEVVATDWEYGGIAALLKYWAGGRNMSFRYARLEFAAAVDAGSLLEAIVNSWSESTKIFLVSHVATGLGFVLPIKEIAYAAKQRGILLLVDGAHAVGAMPLNLTEIGTEIDFYGGNFHKWFLGPEGTGFGWVNPLWNDRLHWKFGGWASDSPPAFYQNYGDKNPETCRRYFPGTIDRAPFLALGEVLHFREKIGEALLRSVQKGFCELAASLALDLGWTLLQTSAQGPMVAFARPESWGREDSVSLATRIYREAGVQLALPMVGDCPLVRLSPGVYASEEEIRQAFVRLRHFTSC